MTKAGRRRLENRVRRLFAINSLADFSLQLPYISFLGMLCWGAFRKADLQARKNRTTANLTKLLHMP